MTHIIKAFCTIFIAELGDKTQLAVLALAAAGKPIYVFIGTCLAFFLISAIGVAVGASIGKIMPQKTMNIVAGALFVALGIFHIIKGAR